LTIRRPSRMSHAHLVGIDEGIAVCGNALPPFQVSARLECSVETAGGVQHAPKGEKVRRGRELSALDMLLLQKRGNAGVQFDRCRALRIAKEHIDPAPDEAA